MPKLTDYQSFAGRHWETGSIHNHWAYRRFHAPHTQQPYSEALLMGISGGIVMGYFSFAYEGYDPHVAILTRNTFDPLDTILTRLGVEQIILQSAKPEKATRNLIESLNEGVPPLVWADQYSLPYNALPHDAGMWHMAPLVVYGYDDSADQTWIADRSSSPLITTTAAFDAARGRIKQDRHKLLILELPDANKVVAAVTAGIWSCIKLFTEKPPKGGRDNFGFAAYQRWSDLLTKPKQRLSWETEFPAGRKMLAALTSTFNMVALFGQEGVSMDAERGRYADFLEEAALLLKKPALNQVAVQFRQSGEAWCELALQLLPDQVPLLQETRHLMVRRHRAFLEAGNASLEQLHAIDKRIAAIQAEVTDHFPLNDEEVRDLRTTLARQVLQIRDLEMRAIEMLTTAM